MRTGGTLEECHALLLIALRCADSRRVKWVGRKARKSLHRCWYFIYAFSIGFFVALCLIDLKIELSLFQTFNSNPNLHHLCCYKQKKPDWIHLRSCCFYILFMWILFKAVHSVRTLLKKYVFRVREGRTHLLWIDLQVHRLLSAPFLFG